MAELAVPITPDDLTPEWLTQALRSGPANLSDCTVDSVSYERIGEDRGIAGPTYRLTLGGTRIPEHLVVKLAHADAASRDRLRSMGMYQREVRFYRELQPSVPVSMPGCFYACYDEVQNAFALVLEDLSDGRFPDDGEGTVEEVAALLREIAPLHAAFWEQDTFPDWLHSEDAQFGLVATRIAGGKQRYEERMGTIDDLQAAIIERLPAALTSGQLKMTGPRTLNHGDLSVKNAAFRPTPVLFDWSLVTPRAPARDVALAIVRSLPPAELRANFFPLIEEYRDALRRAGQNIDADSLRDGVFRNVLSGLGPATVIVVFPPNPTPTHFETSRRTWAQARAMFEFFDPLKMLEA